MNRISSQKYRPYFSAPELSEIIRALKSSSSNLELIRYLETFALKINHGVMDSSYTPKPRLSVEDKLELKEHLPNMGITMQQTAEQKDAARKAAYNKWLNNPESCSLVELAKAAEHRYGNDLMSAEEESAYEARLGL